MSNPVHVRHDENHMATTFELAVSCEPARARSAAFLLESAHREVSRLERDLSEFLTDSPVFALNAAPVRAPVKVSADAIALLEISERLRVRTRGAFDCTAKSSGCIAKPSIAWNNETLEAWRLDDRARVSFGAIGKGYALDRVRNLFELDGFGDFLLNAGGSSLIFSGFSAPGVPWPWGWSWSYDAEGRPLGIPFSHGTGRSMAVGVSGLHEKGLHILDPRSARPASSCRSALVGHPGAAEADALSTALFVSGWEEGSSLLKSLAPGSAAAIIDIKGIAAWNRTFQELWGTIGEPSV